MNYFSGTINKFIIVCICIITHIQSSIWYEKVRGTLEGGMIKGQISSDGEEYLWAKLFSDGLIINIIHYILYIIIFIVAIRIGIAIANNKTKIDNPHIYNNKK